MFFTKRDKPKEPEPDYGSWDHESLLSVFSLCACGQRSVVVLVPPGTNTPEPRCAACDLALSST